MPEASPEAALEATEAQALEQLPAAAADTVPPEAAPRRVVVVEEGGASDEEEEAGDLEGRKEQFKAFLLEKGVVPGQPWDKELNKFCFDARYKSILPGMAHRRAVFDSLSRADVMRVREQVPIAPALLAMVQCCFSVRRCLAGDHAVIYRPPAGAQGCRGKEGGGSCGHPRRRRPAAARRGYRGLLGSVQE